MPKNKIAVKTDLATSVKTVVGISLLLASAGTAAYGFAASALPTRTAPVITISQALTTPDSTIILPNSSNVGLSNFTFKTTTDISVTELTLVNCVARRDADGDCADSGETPGETIGISTVTIQYPDSSGSTVSKTGYMSGDSVTFSGLDFLVDDVLGGELSASISTSDFATLSATSGNKIQLNIDAKNQSFSATNLATSATYTEADTRQYVTGKPMTIRYTKPTLSLSASSPSGASVPGFGEVLRFNISAASTDDVGLSTLLFKVNTIDNANTDWNTCANLASKTKWSLSNLTLSPSTGSSDVAFIDSTGAVCSSTSTAEVAYAAFKLSKLTPTVPKGVAYTFAVKVDTTGASASDDDAIRLDIPAEDAMPTALKALTWSDGSGATGIDGTLINNLTVTGGTLAF